MKKAILVFDRLRNQMIEEKIYGGLVIRALYSKNIFSKILSALILPSICRLSIFSQLYGLLQKLPQSKRKIAPFIHKFGVDASEFEKSIEEFESFNDFFIRRLKPSARTIEQDPDALIMPADARYFAFENIYEDLDVWVKGKDLNLRQLLGGDEELLRRYDRGAMLIARLAPVDYHRFHFPCAGVPTKPKEITGPLFSVNPIALKKNIDYLTENKRVITLFETQHFGTIAYIDIGATYVGTIHQTFKPYQMYRKGDEKGYFSFGGSSLILLFEPGKIVFSQDLIEHTQKKIETRALFGQIMGMRYRE